MYYSEVSLQRVKNLNVNVKGKFTNFYCKVRNNLSIIYENLCGWVLRDIEEPALGVRAG